MNFLAHMVLSDDDDDLLLGNFIADFVKSSEWEHYKSRVVEGIKLHHKIDSFTDNHPVVEKSKERLRPRHGKYSPVVADIMYDHFLARNFGDYHGKDLEKFARSSYDLLHRRWEELPRTAQRVLPYMESGNWLVSYATRAGLESAFYGMSRRASFTNNMEEAVDDIFENYEDFESEFRSFFPLLQNFVDDEVKKILKP